MNKQQSINYHRVAEAIDFIKNNFKNQPSLDEIAAHIHLSSEHFQKLFSEWAGTSPKKFLQYISLNYAKSLLKQEQATLFNTASSTGFSGTSRLHDIFINIEGMTPAEYKNGGKNILINYSFADTPFGKVIIASTPKGICFMAFEEDELIAKQNLFNEFPNATFHQEKDMNQQQALQIFNSDNSNPLQHIKLHLKGTSFQLKVWESLLKIPLGKLTTYGDLAKTIESPNASRAVGTAIGNNPVAYLIPCHRVIQTSGNLGGYMWGTTRKAAIIGWEQALTNE